MRRACFLLSLVLLAGCARNVEVERVLRITDVQTGWYDAGILEDGKNKLVPSVSLRLENVSGEEVSGVQLNAIFRRVGETMAWGEHFVLAINRDGLPPGQDTNPIVLRSQLGYTGTQPRLTMLQNREFVDARVEIYGKQGSRNWVKMGEFTIERQLLTETVPAAVLP
jgi:hypothetical protein